MVWQDWILSVGQIFFIVALIPSVVSNHKPAFSTSVMTGTILAVFGLTYATLELALSSIVALTVAALWYVLAYQKYKQMRGLRMEVSIDLSRIQTNKKTPE